MKERGGVIARGEVLAADVPVQAQVAAQLQPCLACFSVAALRSREQRGERGFEVRLLGDAAFDGADLVGALTTLWKERVNG